MRTGLAGLIYSGRTIDIKEAMFKLDCTGYNHKHFDFWGMICS
jgi:hypothetical protein